GLSRLDPKAPLTAQGDHLGELNALPIDAPPLIFPTARPGPAGRAFQLQLGIHGIQTCLPQRASCGRYLGPLNGQERVVRQGLAERLIEREYHVGLRERRHRRTEQERADERTQDSLSSRHLPPSLISHVRQSSPAPWRTHQGNGCEATVTWPRLTQESLR